MNRKRNVAYIKPEDPEFLKNIKRQAGYDDRNHKFDKLNNSDDDFVEDEESEKPQVVVLKKGDLTAEEAEIEKNKIDKVESETKADLSQRVIFKSKSTKNPLPTETHRKATHSKPKLKEKKATQLLSFDDDGEDDDET